MFLKFSARRRNSFPHGKFLFRQNEFTLFVMNINKGRSVSLSFFFFFTFYSNISLGFPSTLLLHWKSYKRRDQDTANLNSYSLKISDSQFIFLIYHLNCSHPKPDDFDISSVHSWFISDDRQHVASHACQYNSQQYKCDAGENLYERFCVRLTYGAMIFIYQLNHLIQSIQVLICNIDHVTFDPRDLAIYPYSLLKDACPMGCNMKNK